MNRMIALVIAGILMVPSLGATASDVLWRSGFESGTTGDFYGVSISGCASVDVVATPARSGSHAGALTICDGKGGVRLRVEDLVPDVSLPDDAYYSTWFALSETFTGDDTNIFQYKQAVTYDGGKTQTKEVLFSIQADWEEGHGWDLRLKSKINQDTGEWDNIQRVLGHSGPAGIYAPVDRWFHIETRYTWSKTGQGRVTVWLDGAQLWDFTGITTEMDWPYIERPRQWTLNNYVNGTTPSTHTLYVDDAAVALTRQGPSGTAPSIGGSTTTTSTTSTTTTTSSSTTTTVGATTTSTSPTSSTTTSPDTTTTTVAASLPRDSGSSNGKGMNGERGPSWKTQSAGLGLGSRRVLSFIQPTDVHNNSTPGPTADTEVTAAPLLADSSAGIPLSLVLGLSIVLFVTGALGVSALIDKATGRRGLR